MSPSWREQLIIDASACAVVLTRYSRGWRPRQINRRERNVEAGANPNAWQPMIEVIRALVSTPNKAPASALVVLSNQFVRYLLVPWNVHVVKRVEELSVTRELFTRQYGEDMQHWDIRLNGGRAGRSQIAAAIDRELLDALSGLFAGSGIVLQAVRPQFMQVVNAHRGSLGGDAWVVVNDSERMLLGFLRNGDWMSLRSRPAVPSGTPIEPVLEQEALLYGFTPTNEKIYFYDADQDGTSPSGPSVTAPPLSAATNA